MVGNLMLPTIMTIQLDAARCLLGLDVIEFNHDVVKAKMHLVCINLFG